MNFEFGTAGRIVFGPGTYGGLGEIAAGLGRHALVVVGSRTLESTGVIDQIARSLLQHEIDSVAYQVRGEPDVAVVDAGVAMALETGCDLVVGIGGGSALDAAKAIAVLLTNGGSALDYMEVVGKGQSITRPAIPLIAIPTTAGTGTEVTRNAVIADRASRFKASIRGSQLVPRVAIVDPVLTHSLPPAATASTGLDALTQCIEPYVSRRAQPLTDALALEGISLIARSLIRAYSDGADSQPREDVALGSLIGGIALANAGLGAVHGFASPLGGSHPVPHGIACAALLPHVMQANVRALRRDRPDSPTLRKYADVGQCLLGRRFADDEQTIDGGIRFVKDLCGELNVPSLTKFGLTTADVPDLVGRAESASSMRANPITLSSEELTEILLAVIQ